TAAALLAAALAARERWILAAAVCGIAADLNLFLGAWSILNLVLARGALEWLRSRHLPWRDGAVMSVAWFALSAPTVVWALGTDDPAAMTFSFVEYINDTFPYHTFAHREIWTGLAFIALTVATCVTLARLANTERDRLMGVLVATAGVTVAIGSIVV